jgi:hypothetical protein
VINFNPDKMFHGKPCKRGHAGIRYLSGRNDCVECALMRAKDWSIKNHEKRLKIVDEWQKANPEKVKATKAKWDERNIESVRARQKKWWNANPEKAKEFSKKSMLKHYDKVIKRSREWKRKNRWNGSYHCSVRRTAKIQRTPAWADLDKIAKVYKDCPPGMTVDHVIPLRGKLVSGLHVHNNLQYLTPSENAKKKNKFEIA